MAAAGGSGKAMDGEDAPASSAEAEAGDFTYSMWITSSEEPLPAIRTKMWECSNTKGASWPFPPHITLASDIEGEEADVEAAMRAVGRDISTAFEIEFSGVTAGDEPHKCVYLNVGKENDRLKDCYERVMKGIAKQEPNYDSYDPHMSLIYNVDGKLEDGHKEATKKVGEELVAANNKLLLHRIEMWKIDGADPKSWRRVAGAALRRPRKTG